MMLLLDIGKVLFAYLFVVLGIEVFRDFSYSVKQSRSRKIPFPKSTTAVTGALMIITPIMAIFGILELFAFGYMATFIALTAFLYHPYWKETDVRKRKDEEFEFNKLVAVVGAILMLMSFTL